MSAKLLSSSAANFIVVLIDWFDVDDNLISNQTYFDAGLIFPVEVWQDLYAVRTAPEQTAYGIFRLTISVGEGGSPDEAFVLWGDVFMLEDTLFVTGFE
ncbi:hypothetical protein MNBD_GAMMA02-1204 [hydrothermal vent metagenome]|uniref:Uncharacterized protein n=1 Tax=hydrothermal vent metagenome TaxID=652676 RepID=A0A3B0WVA0_9ZZZZ